MITLTEFEKKVVQEAFELPEAPVLPRLCEHAQPYADWCRKVVAETSYDATDVTVNLAHLRLQAQYWNRYDAAPIAHRNHIGLRKGHSCLFQVYRHYYRILRELLFDVNPPLLRETPPPLPPVTPQIAGVPFGILTEGEEALRIRGQ